MTTGELGFGTGGGAGRAPGARVIVVDDEPGVRDYLQALLESRGYQVELHATLGEVRRALASSAGLPDLLIVDVGLPDGSGLDLVREVRERGLDVPVIILSGRRDQEDFERGFAAGAVDYLSKPVAKDELLARCAVHVARAHATTGGDAGLPGRDGLAFGRYQITRQLGRGGYGHVLLARDTAEHGTLVALKVLTRDEDEQAEMARLRFIREAYTLSRVHHDRVARVRDFGTYAGRNFLALEFVDGPSLRQFIAQGGPLGEAATRTVARGLLQALTAVDQAGLVHRDVKPDNVILQGGDLRRPVLVDFGLAKEPHDRSMTDARTLMGTLAFLSPEVIDGRDADRRSDLFALGLTLRYALVAETVFPQLSGIHLMEAIARRPIPPPEVPLSAAFGAWLASLVARAPDDRPASPTVALEALEALPAAPTASAPIPQPNQSTGAYAPTVTEARAAAEDADSAGA